MPRDANGNYTLTAENPVVTGTTITPLWANATMDDLASEMTNSLSRDGQGGMRAPMLFSDGTTSAPGITFATETTLGLLRPSSSVMSVTVLANEVARFNAGNQLELFRNAEWQVALSGDLTADRIINVPAGNITSTDQQAVNNELDGQDTALQALIDQNILDIADNVETIGLNRTDINQNIVDINTNAGAIATNAGDIATNTGDIATNAGDIATNTADIIVNGVAIVANADAIDAINAEHIWGVIDGGDGTVVASNGLTAVRNSSGRYTITLDTARASVNYMIQATAQRDSGDTPVNCYVGRNSANPITTTTFAIRTVDNTAAIGDCYRLFISVQGG